MFVGGPLFEALFYVLENLLEKWAFFYSKLGNWPLLEHGPVIVIFLYLFIKLNVNKINKP